MEIKDYDYPCLPSDTYLWCKADTHSRIVESSGTGEGCERASTKEGVLCTNKAFVIPHFLHTPKYFLLLSLPPEFGNEAGGPLPLCSHTKPLDHCRMRDLSAAAPHLCLTSTHLPQTALSISHLPSLPTAAPVHLPYPQHLPATFPAHSSSWTQQVYYGLIAATRA